MFRSRLFWRLFATYAALVLAVLAFTGWIVHREVRQELLDSVEARLAGQATALVPFAEALLEGPRAEAARSRIEELGREAGARITVVDADGEVQADSAADPATMDNHASRPEILQALAGEPGRSIRFSPTTRTERLYVARPVPDDAGVIGAVRVSITLEELDTRLGAVRRDFLGGAALALFLALALGMVVARRITAPITEMTEVAEAIRGGDYERRIRPRPPGEPGVLADTINRLADELTERIEDLVHKSAHLDAFIRGMQEGVLAVDDQDRVIFSNRAGRRLLELRGDAEGQRLWEATRVPGLTELLSEARGQETPARQEIVLRRRAEEIILDARATPFEAKDTRGVVLVLYDITNLRRLERIRTDFVANVSHELKTPLTSIQGYVETLLDGALDDPEHNVRFLERIGRQVRRLSALVSDLLSLARIESPQETLRIEPLEWRTLVDRSVAHHRDMADDRGVDLRVEEGPAARIRADAEAAAQILDNLLDNAISYTPEGGRVTVSTRIRDDGGCVVVSDTGVGIPAGALERIFERFYRVDRGRSRELGGTGLGLSIVKNLTQRMGGSVTVESDLGEGSTFTVCLPLADDR